MQEGAVRFGTVRPRVQIPGPEPHIAPDQILNSESKLESTNVIASMYYYVSSAVA